MTVGFPNKKTFCPAPWFQIRNRHDMTKTACCRMYWTPHDPETKNMEPLQALNTNLYKEVKKNLHSGIKDKNCRSCWQDEKHGLQSLRQKYMFLLQEANPNYLKNYFANKKNYESDTILSADIKIGNTCNYACVMCFPSASSLVYNKWTKDKSSEFVKEQLKLDPLYLDKVKKYSFANDQYLEYVMSVVSNNKDLFYLKLLGGEPLLSTRVLKYLHELPVERKKKITLQFTTNASKDVVGVLKYLGEFKQFNIVISLEGVGPLQEYARWGSRWHEQEKFILELKAYAEQVKNINISLQHCFQTTTVLGFKNLVDWCVKNKINMGFLTTLVEPDYLSLSTLPENSKKEIIKVLEQSNFKVDRNVYQNEDDEQTFTKEQLINLLKSTQFDFALYKRFLRYIEWYEKDKKGILPLKKQYPELFIETVDEKTTSKITKNIKESTKKWQRFWQEH